MNRCVLLLRGVVLACIALAMCGREACAGWIDSESELNSEWLESPFEFPQPVAPTMSGEPSVPQDPTLSRFASLTELLLGLAEALAPQPAHQQSTSSGQLSSTSLSPPALGSEERTEPPALSVAVSPRVEIYHPRLPVDELLRPPQR